MVLDSPVWTCVDCLDGIDIHEFRPNIHRLGDSDRDDTGIDGVLTVHAGGGASDYGDDGG